MRVLVVEDHVTLADRLAQGLRQAGMAVDAVFDGAAVLEAAAQTAYDVIVLDRDLPVVHGGRVCRALARHRGNRTAAGLIIVAASLLHHVGFSGAEMTAEVEPLAVEDLVNAGAVVIDVRELDEWSAGHAPEARFIPMGQVEARLGEVPRDGTAVIVCRSGARSHTVTQFLNSHGINAVNMSGGMRAWEKAGLPVVTDAGDPGLIV